MNRCSVFVVEDEIVVAEDLIYMLKSAGYQLSGHATSGEEAISQLQEVTPDLVLLDIKLQGDLNGFDVARSLGKDIPYIFITSLKDTRSRAEIADLSPAGYILKPFVEEEILVNVQLAMKPKESKKMSGKPVGFMIRDSTGLKRISPSEILFAKGEDNYTQIELEDGSTYLISHTLKSVEAKLVDTNLFYRVHKSYLINLNHVMGVEGRNVVLKKRIIPIGKQYRVGLFERFDVL